MPNDPFMQGLGIATAPNPVEDPGPKQPQPKGDPFVAGLSGVKDPFMTGLSPESGQQKPESTSMLGKAWDWANTPLVNFNPSNQGGFTGGTEDVLSGLISPLSIGLTAATLGAGPLLRGLGLAAEELPVAVRGLKGLMDAGFTAQGAYQVAKESPRVLDAIKEGDYETAKRLAVHVAAGGAMTYLGVRHGAADVGEYLGKAGDELGFQKFRPSDLVKKTQQSWGVRNREREQWHQEADTFAKENNKEFKALTPEQREGVLNMMQASNKRELIDRHNMRAEAAGRANETLPGGSIKLGPEIPFEGEETTGEKVPVKVYPLMDGQNGIGRITISFEDPKTANIRWVGSPDLKVDPDSGLGELSNKIGPSNIRDLARQVKKLNPEVENVKGLRIGGSAAGQLRDEQTIPIDKIIGDSSKANRYDELIAQQNIKNNYTPEEIDKLLDGSRAAINPTPEMVALASKAKSEFTRLLEYAKSKGILRDGIENYISQIWEKPEENGAANLLRDAATGSKFGTNLEFARKRVFENAVEGQLLGKKLKSSDPIALVSNYMARLGEVSADRNFKEAVLGLRASDGRPAAALSGSGHVVEGEDGETTAHLFNPRSAQDVRIRPETVEFMKKAGVFDKWLENGTITKLNTPDKESYGWNTHDYKESPSSAFEDWHYAAQAADRSPVLVRARYVMHPEVADYLNNLIGKQESPIRQMKPLNWLLKASSEAKHVMLSFSPFHIAQEGLRALMTGISPFHLKQLDINAEPNLGKIVEAGLTRGKDSRSLADYDDSLSEGLGGRSKVLDTIGKLGDKLGIVGKPLSVLRDIQNYATDFTFEKYIPALKDRAALKFYDRWTEQLQNDKFFDKLQNEHPEYKGLSKDQAAAKLAADETNERFGGLNYKMLGRAVGTQDFLRLATLAPDWLESEMRSIKRVFDPTGGVMARRDFVRMTAAMWVTSRVLNMLLTGKMHNEAPFGVAWTDKDGKEKIYSIRSLPSDMFHATTDPLGFLHGRMSPLVRTTIEAGSGRDFQGRKLSPFDTGVDIIRNNFTPIPAQAIFKGATGGSPDLNTPDQAVKALGATATVYRTEAQKLALQLASNKNETGPVDPSQLAKHRAVIDLENQIRSGQAPMDTLNTLVEQGHLAPKDAKAIHKNVQETQGMDPEMAQMYTQATRLPMPDFLKIWDAATPAEQSALTKLLIKKRQQYNQKVMKDLTPSERLSDPTYLRLKQMFPAAPVF